MFHRNSQKRIYVEGATYFITSVTYHRYPYFNEPILAELFVCDLWFGKALKEFELYGYNVLPDHMHLLIQPMGRASYSDIMGTLKRNASRDINDLVQGRPFIRETPLNTSDGDDSNRLLQMNFELTKKDHPHLPFEIYARHWSSLESLRRRYDTVPQHINPRLFRWQKSFRDHIIRNGRDFDNHLDYIYNNAVKHGLADEPEHWPWMWVHGMPAPYLVGPSNMRLL